MPEHGPTVVGETARQIKSLPTQHAQQGDFAQIAVACTTGAPVVIRATDVGDATGVARVVATPVRATLPRRCGTDRKRRCRDELQHYTFCIHMFSLVIFLVARRARCKARTD
jgi:hypothetical protein